MTLAETVRKVSEFLNISKKEAEKVLEKSVVSGEMESLDKAEQWISERLVPNTVFIDDAGYAKMCIDALKNLNNTAATDYGSSRMRDLGQLWADTTRGYLGEYALGLFLLKKFGINIELNHEEGALKDFLPSDVHGVMEAGAGKMRKPKIQISVKSTKLNGIWLDIPGAQIQHSHAHVLVKLGTGRDHLFAYLKSISVFRDKILLKGKEQGHLSQEEAEKIWQKLPTFQPIPAYVSGFCFRDSTYENLSYDGKKGKKHFTVTSWNGPLNPGDMARIKEREKIAGDVKFEGIGEFKHDTGYLFSTGKLLWSKKEWAELVCKI